MADSRLKEFYDREVNEIMQNKLRFGFIVVCLVASVALFAFTDTETEVTEASDNESLKVAAASNDKLASDIPSVKDKSDKPASKVTSITGLEKASEGVELINPFKSDLIKPPSEVKSSKLESIPIPQTSKPASIKTVETEEKAILILKGTAISGNKKMAIIQRNIIKNNKTNVDPKLESRIVKVGDKIDSHIVVDIGKNFILFDDGRILTLQEGL